MRYLYHIKVILKKKIGKIVWGARAKSKNNIIPPPASRRVLHVPLILGAYQDLGAAMGWHVSSK